MRGYRYAAKLFKGLAHPERLAILQVLRVDGESCVCHLEHALDQRQAYISQQLARLREVDLVTDRRDGLNVYYSLSNPATEALIDAAIELARGQLVARGAELVFERIHPDHRDTCPCPKCEAEVGVVEVATEAKR